MDFIQVLAYLFVCFAFSAVDSSGVTNNTLVQSLPVEAGKVQFIGEAVQHEISSVSTVTPSYGTNIEVITKFTIQPTHDSDCRDIAVNFAYKNNLCLGAKRPESYLIRARSHYSCFSRCGQIPPPTEGFSECGCDELCYIFRDCCEDMAEMCPDQFSRRNNPDYPPNLSRFRSCSGRNVEFFSHGYSSTVTPLYSFTSAELNQVGAVLMQHKTLRELVSSLNYFRVVDLKTRLIFVDYVAYRRLSTATSIPAYVPMVAGLVCSKRQGHSNRLPTVGEMLPRCWAHEIYDAMTPYHRSCKKHIFQRCPFDGGNILFDHIHNLCLGPNISHYREYRFPLWRDHAKYGLSEHETCSLIRVTSTSSTPYHLKKSVKYASMIRITPLMKHFRSRSVNSSEDIVAPKQKERPEIELDFAVDITNTVEKSFLCPSLRSYITDCQLVSCVAGALLWIEDLQENIKPARRSCIFPSKAMISTTGGNSTDVLSCICLQALAVFNVLDVWETKYEEGSERGCVISLRILPRPKQPIDLDIMHTLTESNHFTSTSEKTATDLKALLQLLSTSTQLCDKNIDQAFKICFSNEDIENKDTSNLCMSWGDVGTDHTGHSSSRSSPRNKAFVNIAILMVAVAVSFSK